MFSTNGLHNYDMYIFQNFNGTGHSLTVQYDQAISNLPCRQLMQTGEKNKGSLSDTTTLVSVFNSMQHSIIYVLRSASCHHGCDACANHCTDCEYGANCQCVTGCTLEPCTKQPLPSSNGFQVSPFHLWTSHRSSNKRLYVINAFKGECTY